MTDKWLRYQFDNIQVDLQNFKVWKAGSPVLLEPKAFAVLVFFINNQGRLVEKNELLEAVWSESFVTPNALTRVIAQLRKGLGDDPKEARYIETVPTRGYRFIPAVQTLESVTAATQNSHAPAVVADETPRNVPPVELTPVSDSSAKLLIIKLLTVAGGTVLVAVLAFFLWQRRTASEWVTVLKTTQITSSPLVDMYSAFSPDGQSLAYCTIKNSSLEVMVKPLTPGSREVQVTSDGAQNMQPSWSPDGRFLAYHSGQRGGIWVVPALGGVARQLVSFGADPAWSPDGKWIVFQSEAPVDINQMAFAALPPSTLWRVPTQGGAALQLTHKEFPAGGHGAPAWSPDGRRIVFVSYVQGGHSEIWTMNAEGKDLQQFSSSLLSFFDPVFSSDGRFIFMSSGGSGFQLWRKRLVPETGQPLGEPEEIANTGAALARYLTLAPDGKHLAYSSLMMANNLGSVQLSPKTGTSLGVPQFLTQDTNRRKTSPSFAPDGKSLVYSQWRAGANGELWLIDSDGSNPRQLTSGLAGLPNWMADGKQIAVVAKDANDLKMWVVDTETRKQSVISAQTFPEPLGKLSLDGKWFAFNSHLAGTYNIALLPVAGGPAKQLTFDQELMGFPCWSRDSQWLAFEMKRGDNSQLALIPREGGTPEQLTNEPGQHWPGSWAADHDRIAFAKQQNSIWNVGWISRRTKVQEQLTHYTQPNTYVRYPTWSPLGNQIVYEFGETTGNIWVLEMK